jgi:hypothetical protein
VYIRVKGLIKMIGGLAVCFYICVRICKYVCICVYLYQYTKVDGS